MTCHANIFCEVCGDCLECYDEDPCIDGGPHQAPPPDELARLVAENERADSERAMAATESRSASKGKE